MRIDYCPKCHKAGLRYENPDGLDPKGFSRTQRYEAYKHLGETSAYGTAKWCPRCQVWVKPSEEGEVKDGRKKS